MNTSATQNLKQKLSTETVQFIINQLNRLRISKKLLTATTKKPELHHIDKHLTRVAHSDFKRLSTTGYIFSAAPDRHLGAAASFRAVAAAVSVAAGAASVIRLSRSRTQRRQIRVASAAMSRSVIFQGI